MKQHADPRIAALLPGAKSRKPSAPKKRKPRAPGPIRVMREPEGEVGRLLLRVRREQRLSLRTLGARAHLDFTSLSRIGTGEYRVTVATALALEDAVGVPAEKWLVAQMVDDLRRERAQRTWNQLSAILSPARA